MPIFSPAPIDSNALFFKSLQEKQFRFIYDLIGVIYTFGQALDRMQLKLILLLLFYQQSFSQIAVEFSSKSASKIELLKEALISPQIEDSQDINSIQNASFQIITDSLVREPYQYAWVKFELNNTSSDSIERKLRLFSGWCERVDVYYRETGSEDHWHYSKAGFMTPSDSLTQDSDHTLLPYEVNIKLAGNEKREYYCKYYKVYRPFLELRLTLYSNSKAAEIKVSETKDYWATAAFIGMILVLSVFNLLYFTILRDNAYLWYSLFGFAMIFGATVMDDYNLLYYQLFFTKNTTLFPWVYMFAGNVSTILYIQFSRSYLDSKRYYPILDKILIANILIGSVVLFIVSLIFIKTGRQFSPYLPFAGFMALIGVLYIVQIIAVLRKKNVADLFLVIGIGLLMVCVLPHQLKELLFPNEYYYKKPLISSISVLQLGTLLEMIVFALGLGYRTRQLKRDKNQLETLDQLKSKFFTDISHELRTPLMLIKGPLQQIRKKLVSAEDLSLADMAEKHSDKLLYMVNQILELSKIESNKVDLLPAITDLIVLSKGVFYSFESLAKAKDIDLIFESKDRSIPMDLDIEKMETIITNLTTNAIKYSNPGGTISLSVERIKDYAILIIKDTGIGIAQNDLDMVFDRYFQKSDKSTSFGIGLALTKELVLLHNGEIKVNSQEGKGSTLEIKLPITTKSTTLVQNPIKLPAQMQFAKEQIILNPSINDKGKHVLIVEDNADVRTFLELQLAHKYVVSMATNGIEGVKKARHAQPDIIISDVMMPYKDGYGLTQTLKTDILTSHIPIILLTAKVGQMDKLEGLSAGADAYLTKPVDFNELEIRIENLIKLRKELRTRFAENLQIHPSEVSVNSVDVDFMEKLTAIIETNISNENFSVEEMSQEIGLSSRQLNRKLVALINKTPAELLKSIRLQRAADLLSQDAGTIADIAFQTGFRSAAYFSTSFKNHFGKTPKDYKK